MVTTTEVFTEFADRVKMSAVYTTTEVAKHNTPQDCWVIIKGVVYDVTAWVPKHPGGAMIYLRAGMDCSQLFEMYHPETAYRTLEKYQIGRISDTENLLPTFECDQKMQDFYPTIKARVKKHMMRRKLKYRFSWSLYIKAAMILGGVALGYYLSFWVQNFALGVIGAVMMGVCAACIGTCIQHDANHGAFCENPTLCHLAGITLDVVGASSFMWKQQHVAGHHVWTNIDGYDPDIRVSDPDIRRVTITQPWRDYHKAQHVYLGALYGALAFKSVAIDDFKSISEGKIGTLNLANMAKHEVFTFWATKFAYLIYHVIIPCIYSPRPWYELAFLYVLSYAFEGWLLAFLFQVAHVVDDAAYPMPKDNKFDYNWAALQIETTCNFAPGSFFWNHFSGGLNHQIEHHLFPGMAHTHYPTIAPIVQATCKEFGVKYHSYPTFYEALKAHFSYLKKVGITPGLPSLSTIG